MLQRLAAQVADCHRRARDARERAEHAPTDIAREDYLVLERRWLLLAESYQLTQRIADFQAEAKRQIAIFRPPTPPDPAVPRANCPNCGRKMKLIKIEPANTSRRADANSFRCSCGETTEIIIDRLD